MIDLRFIEANVLPMSPAFLRVLKHELHCVFTVVRIMMFLFKN